MPQRQDTQGDFGLRPTKVTQGITDTYHAPSIVKPDISGLKAIAGLSKTAAALLQESQANDARQMKEGEAYGEANPNAELAPTENISIFGVETPFTRGTTEAAMAGFQKGRGRALQDTFREQTMGAWAVMVEEDENLKLEPDKFTEFLQTQETGFIEQNGIDGLALGTFGLGREQWMLGEINKNNLASVRYQKGVLKKNLSEVTASSLLSLSDITTQTEGTTNSELGELLRSTNSAYMESLDGEARTLRDTIEEAMDTGAGMDTILNLPDSILLKDPATLTAEDMSADPRIREVMENTLKASRVSSEVLPPIQGVLQEAYDVGGETELEIRGAVIEDLITSLSEGKSPEETWMLLSELKSGTGLLRDTNQFRAAFEGSREKIEANGVARRRTYEDKIMLFRIADNIDKNTTQAEMNAAVTNVRNAIESGYLTEEEAYQMETKMWSNFGIGQGLALEETRDTYFAAIAMRQEKGSPSDMTHLSASQIVEFLLDEEGIEVTEGELRAGVARAITFNARRQYPDDPVAAAQAEVEAIRRLGLFASDVPKMLTHRINIGGNQGTQYGGPENMTLVEEGLYLYRASKGMLTGAGLSAPTRAYYSFIDAKTQQEGVSLSDAVELASSLHLTWGDRDVRTISLGAVADLTPSGTSDVVNEQVRKLSNALMQDYSASEEDVVELSLEILKSNLVGELNGRDIRRSGNPTLDAKLSYYNETLVANFKTQWVSEEKELEFLVKKLNYEDGQNIEAKVAAIELHYERRGKEKLGAWEINRELRGVEEIRYAAALRLFEAKNGRPAMVAQSAFSGVDFRSSDPQVGISSTMAGPLSYQIINLETKQPIPFYNGKALGNVMSANDLVLLLDDENNEYMVMSRQVKEENRLEWQVDFPRDEE